MTWWVGWPEIIPRDYCTLGPAAFTSENFCASVLLHENVHGSQNPAFRIASVLSWEAGGVHYAEVEAYSAEITNSDRLGLRESELNEVIAYWNWYNTTGPEP